jgi:hypothetical protein
MKKQAYILFITLALVGCGSGSRSSHMSSTTTSQKAQQSSFLITNANNVATADQVKWLDDKLVRLEKRFPNLFAKVQANGFATILIREKETSENGGAVLGEADGKKQILIFTADLFTVDQQKPLSNLGYLTSDIAVMHEMMHAFDMKGEIVGQNYKLLGWSDIQDMKNLWITQDEVKKMQEDLTPKLKTEGPWQVTVEARNLMKAHGYPSIYAVVGGPAETFAELGAFIAMDPSASTYIAAETINWYRKNVLN